MCRLYCIFKAYFLSHFSVGAGLRCAASEVGARKISIASVSRQRQECEENLGIGMNAVSSGIIERNPASAEVLHCVA
jgi:hypothetical protein